MNHERGGGGGQRKHPHRKMDLADHVAPVEDSARSAGQAVLERKPRQQRRQQKCDERGIRQRGTGWKPDPHDGGEYPPVQQNQQHRLQNAPHHAQQRTGVLLTQFPPDKGREQPQRTGQTLDRRLHPG